MFKITIVLLALTCCISASTLLQSRRLCGEELPSTVVLMCRSLAPTLNFNDVVIPQALADECCQRPCSPATLVSFCPLPPSTD